MLTKLGSAVLTDAERERIEQARRSARARARAQLDRLDEHCEPSAFDPDNPPMTEKELDELRPAHEVRPELVLRRWRDAPSSAPTSDWQATRQRSKST